MKLPHRVLLFAAVALLGMARMSWSAEPAPPGDASAQSQVISTQRADKEGTVVYGTTTNQAPMRDGTVGFGDLQQNASYIDFAAAQSYVSGLSTSWSQLVSNGTTTVTAGNIKLEGHDPNQNIFSVAAADLNLGSLSFDFVFDAIATGSTILVNITGNLPTLNLMHMGFTFNGIDGEAGTPFPSGQDYRHNAGFPYSNILFNFADETGEIHMDFIALNGSLIAPFANVTSTKDSHIDGNLIALSLIGDSESHAIPFQGNIVPEPGTLLLLAGGLIGMVAQRRRK